MKTHYPWLFGGLKLRSEKSPALCNFSTLLRCTLNKKKVDCKICRKRMKSK